MERHVLDPEASRPGDCSPNSPTDGPAQGRARSRGQAAEGQDYGHERTRHARSGNERPRLLKKTDPCEWQYHPRSDHHSKAVCWAILFDLLQASSLMREHARDGLIAFGINHKPPLN